MTAAPGTLTVASGGTIRGRCTVPGDKSITHRALIFAALAAGESHIEGALDARDTRATDAALSALGAGIEWDTQSTVRIRGTAGRWRAPQAPLDLGNSGTGLRLLAGALAGRGIAATLTGDASLRRRPMRRITEPLTAMGAAITTSDGLPPLEIVAHDRLHGIAYRLPVASAQVKSALLLAALAAEGETRIEDPWGTRDHSERMLPLFGAKLQCEGNAVVLQPGTLAAADIAVPGDLSAAAFLIAAVLLTPDARLSITGVGVNPTRSGFLSVLERMGAQMRLSNRRRFGNEPVSDIEVAAGDLKGIVVAAEEIPSLIDELPALMVLAACAGGETVIEGAGELRHKESDRIEAMRAGLSALGAKVEIEGERIRIGGGGFSCGGCVESAGDHRVAMSLALAGLAAPMPVTVNGAAWIETSFPGFADSLRAAGAQVDCAA
ncbi:MAG: 3-phosphoshikimate 1-carboxyvinyltransferase [Gammaproteobacteria bacterium]